MCVYSLLRLAAHTLTFCFSINSTEFWLLFSLSLYFVQPFWVVITSGLSSSILCVSYRAGGRKGWQQEINSPTVLLDGPTSFSLISRKSAEPEWHWRRRLCFCDTQSPMCLTQVSHLFDSSAHWITVPAVCPSFFPTPFIKHTWCNRRWERRKRRWDNSSVNAVRSCDTVSTWLANPFLLSEN